MKIVDDQGRLFGKINLIDFLVILFLFCILPMFYFGYKFITGTNTDSESEKEYVEIVAECQIIKLEPEQLQLISVGDKELDENGQVIGEIVYLGESKPHEYKLNLGEAQEFTKEDPYLKQVQARLKLKAGIRSTRAYYKQMVIKIGMPLTFRTNNYSVIAIPYDTHRQIFEERVIDLYVVLKDLDENTANLFSVGDKELNESKETIAEVLGLGEIKNSTFMFDLEDRNFVLGEDKTKKQIFAKMRLKCQMRENDQLFFKGKRVTTSLPFEFKTDKYKAMGLPTKAYHTEKWVLIKVRFSGVYPELANAIHERDAEKDPDNEVVAMVESIISNKPSILLKWKGVALTTVEHPFCRDIVMSINVRCIEKGGIFYFKNQSVKMGNSIVFSTELYSLSGLIVGVLM